MYSEHNVLLIAIRSHAEVDATVKVSCIDRVMAYNICCPQNSVSALELLLLRYACLKSASDHGTHVKSHLKPIIVIYWRHVCVIDVTVCIYRMLTHFIFQLFCCIPANMRRWASDAGEILYTPWRPKAIINFSIFFFLMLCRMYVRHWKGWTLPHSVRWWVRV